MELYKPIAEVDQNVTTKRMVLSSAAKFYVPLGLISPVILQLNILFKELCNNKVAWDDGLSASLCARWKSIISSLREAGVTWIDRCYFHPSPKQGVKSIQLHAIADACETSYGACVYLRHEYDTSVQCNLVASNTRVAP